MRTWQNCQWLHVRQQLSREPDFGFEYRIRRGTNDGMDGWLWWVFGIQRVSEPSKQNTTVLIDNDPVFVVGHALCPKENERKNKRHSSGVAAPSECLLCSSTVAHSNDLLQRHSGAQRLKLLSARSCRFGGVYWYQLSYSVAASQQQSTSTHYHTSIVPTKYNVSVQTPLAQTLHCPWSSFIAVTLDLLEWDGESWPDAATPDQDQTPIN